jgi:hypothetical protein
MALLADDYEVACIGMLIELGLARVDTPASCALEVIFLEMLI